MKPKGSRLTVTLIPCNKSCLQSSVVLVKLGGGVVCGGGPYLFRLALVLLLVVLVGALSFLFCSVAVVV